MITDDHKIFMDGITSLLQDHPDIEVAAHANDGESALAKLEHVDDINVLITDISMPNVDGEILCKEVKKKYPHIQILVLSMHSDSKTIKRMLKNGAVGYILKNTGKEELFDAIRYVAEGKTYFSEKVKNNIMAGISGREESDVQQKVRLTRREVEILQLITAELTTTQIAEKLFISLHTVESHRKNIMRKTKAKNMAGLIKYAVREGIAE